MISKRIGEKDSTVGVIIRKWKKRELTLDLSWSGAPRKISQQGIKLMMRKVREQLRTLQQELVDDIKAAGTTITKITITNTLHQSGLKSCSARKIPQIKKEEKDWKEVPWSDENKI